MNFFVFVPSPMVRIEDSRSERALDSRVDSSSGAAVAVAVAMLVAMVMMVDSDGAIVLLPHKSLNIADITHFRSLGLSGDHPLTRCLGMRVALSVAAPPSSPPSSKSK